MGKAGGNAGTCRNRTIHSRSPKRLYPLYRSNFAKILRNMSIGFDLFISSIWYSISAVKGVKLNGCGSFFFAASVQCERHLFALRGESRTAVGTVFIASASGLFPRWVHFPSLGITRRRTR